MVATAVSATIGTATLLAFQQTEFLNAGLLWMTWWLGDFGGAVIVAPLLILWATQPEIPFRPVRILEGLGVLFAMWVAAHAVFGGWLPARGAPIMYLCIPALVYTAFRFGPRETATATALLAGVSIMGTVAGEGPFANVDDNAALLYLQGFMVVIGPTLLSLAAGVAIHRESQQGLLRARDELERRVQERTRELVAINAALELEIQERVRTEARVRRSEESLLEAERLARLGNWSWDVGTNRVTWSEELLRIYGLRTDEFAGTFEAFLDRLPPNDRAVAERIIGDSMENGRPFDFYHRVIRPNGTERILHARGTVETDTTGHVVRIFGTGQDVTELKQAEAALRQAHEELERRVATRTRELAAANEQLHAKIEDLEAFEQAVVGRELKMIALERELDELRARLEEMSRDGN
jgi:PAS domain S-box-containing protein